MGFLRQTAQKVMEEQLQKREVLGGTALSFMPTRPSEMSPMGWIHTREGAHPLPVLAGCGSRVPTMEREGPQRHGPIPVSCGHPRPVPTLQHPDFPDPRPTAPGSLSESHAFGYSPSVGSQNASLRDFQRRCGANQQRALPAPPAPRVPAASARGLTGVRSERPNSNTALSAQSSSCRPRLSPRPGLPRARTGGAAPHCPPLPVSRLCSLSPLSPHRPARPRVARGADQSRRPALIGCCAARKRKR